MTVQRAILFRDVKPGYGVVDVQGWRHTVVKIHNSPEGAPPPPFLLLELENGLYITGDPDDLIAVWRIPRADGQDERKALADVLEAARAVVFAPCEPEALGNMPRLREALDAYELEREAELSPLEFPPRGDSVHDDD
ncbi:MAG TPA: hypothetical protein VD862_01635 [Candidatus Paceibacterota bacterium]|nr:hypothetical protein [Candidatus Paceibacterota bacterium]